MNSSQRSKKYDFVRTGWFALHEAVLRSGAEIDTGSFWKEIEGRWLDKAGYVLLLRPIIKITGVTIQTPSDDAFRIGKEIWARCLTFKKQLAIPSNAFARTSMHGFYLAYSEWRRSQGRSFKSIDPIDPISAAKIGWQLIQKRAKDGVDNEMLFWGLGILGWVTVAYSRLGICRYCFRWNVPGSPFCFLHTQSRATPEKRGSAYVRYRKGARIYAAAQKQKVWIKNRPSLVDYEYKYMVISEFLFFNTVSKNEGLELRRQLSMAPQVLRLLGGKKVLALSDRSLYTKLRVKVNPMEFFPPILIGSIPMAENLLALEATSRPGRPVGQRTKRLTSLLEKAIVMFGAGVTPSKVAIKLGVSPSVVSNWITRYDDVKKVIESGKVT